MNPHFDFREKVRRSPATVGLLLLLLCSSFFALYNSNAAYSSDEVWSVKTAGLNYTAGVAALKLDVHPPLYFLILRVWLRLFGTGERVIRSLSGLFYILSVLAVYGLGRELYGKKAALLCTAIYLSSPLAILTAQFARMYSLLSLLSILSTWLYLQFLVKPRDSRLLFALYVAVNVLGTFTHIAFFFLLFGQVVFHFLFYRRTSAKRFVVSIVLSAVPYLFLWAPTVWRQIGNSSEGLAWVQKPALFSLAELLLLYGGAFWLLVPVLLYLWWRSGFESCREFSKLHTKSLPLWLLGITVLTPFLVSQCKPIFNSRLAIVGLHFFALAIGALIGRRVSYFLIIELIVLTAIGIVFVRLETSTCDNRAIATYISRTVSDGDAVIFTSLTRLPIDYYLERQSGTKKLLETSFPAEIDNHPGYEGRINDPERKPALEREAAELIDKISSMQLRERGGRIFFLRGRHPQIDSIVEASLRKRFELIPGEGLRCDESSPYFKEIIVFK